MPIPGDEFSLPMATTDSGGSLVGPDTRNPMGSGYMQQQYLAEERAHRDILGVPDEYAEEIRQANEQLTISMSMEHARGVPGVEYPDLDSYLVAAERLYNIMKNGYPNAE